VRWLNCSNGLILTLGFALIIGSLLQLVAQRLGNGFANVNSLSRWADVSFVSTHFATGYRVLGSD
jgi:hypothetical protein